VNFDTSLVGQGFNAELGRTGYQIDPYIFQRPDVTPYFQNERWDSGKWTFDGGILGFHFGGARLNVFGGRQSDRFTSQDPYLDLNPMTAGQIGRRYHVGGARPIGLPNSDFNDPNEATRVPIDQHLGLHLNVPITDNGKLDLAYVWLESNAGVSVNNVAPPPDVTGGRVANRVQVFGGNLKYNFGAVVLEGGYSQSNVQNGRRNVVNRDNYAWHAQLGYDAAKWGASVGYREIQPQFAAPGDWGRIGLWWNPTDIRGVAARAHFNLSDAAKITASGEWYNGVGRTITLPDGTKDNTGLSTDDRIQRYTAELGYRLNPSWNLSLGAEWVDWDLKDRADLGFTGGRPRERWYNIGLGYNLSDMAKLSFLWQISDYDSKGVAGFSPFRNTSPVNTDHDPATRARGSLITTQLSIKF
jgi:predicted porin